MLEKILALNNPLFIDNFLFHYATPQGQVAMHNPVNIISRKYDSTINHKWVAKLLHKTDDFWIFKGKFEKEINHPTLGIIRNGTISYEYYWKQKWFNVFRFHEPSGEFKFFYCNLNMPPSFDSSTLDYIDLDIDLLVHKDLKVEILDLDEFTQNSQFYAYPDDLIRQMHKGLAELLEMIETKTFPFDTIDCEKKIILL